MKRNINMLIVAFATLLTLASCSKDIDLVGTHWQGHGEKVSSGLQMRVDYTLHFATEAAGTIDVDVTMTQSGQTPQSYGDTWEMEYTFDGEQGYISAHDQTMHFTYNKKEKTLTLNNIQGGIGSTATFTQIK